MRSFMIVCAFCQAFFLCGLSAAELVTTAADQTSLSLTIYNSDLALVRDTRNMMLPQGEHTLAFKEISSAIQPETALLKAGRAVVVEQNFEFDLLSPATLLNKYVGKEITIVRENSKTGAEKRFNAKVLSTSSGIVLKIGENIETEIDGRIIFPDVPANLRERPTLTMLIHNDEKDMQQLQLSYLTRGITWKADYVAELNNSEDRIDIKGWVTLTNRSGASYNNSRLQLVAGEVNRVQPERFASEMAAADMMQRAPGRAAQQMSRETLLEYHLYTVSRPATILDNQSKQLALLKEYGGICSKELLLRSRNQSYYWGKVGEIAKGVGVEVFLKMKNDKESNLGLPKPAGVVRVYKQDKDGFSQFIGEDRIKHTPENEEIKIKLGEAFDVTADRIQTDFAQVRAMEKGRIHESEYEITLKNAKNEPAVVTVEEQIPGDWEMLKETHPHKKESANTVSWRMEVKPKGKILLQYRVRTKL